MIADDRRHDRPVDGGEIILTKEGDWYVAHDLETGVTSQGKTRPEAVANLAEALELYERPVPEGEDVDEPATAPWL